MQLSKAGRSIRSTSDFLPVIGALAAAAILTYRFLLPQPSAPLEGLQHQALMPPGSVRLIELGATHCPSCLAMTPILEQVQRAYHGKVDIRVLYLDKSDDHAEASRLASLASVRYTPTFLVLNRNGRAAAKFIGPTSYAALAGALDSALVVAGPPGSAPRGD